MITSLMTLSQEKPGESGFNNKTAILKASKPNFLILRFASWQSYKARLCDLLLFFKYTLCTAYFKSILFAICFGIIILLINEKFICGFCCKENLFNPESQNNK